MKKGVTVKIVIDANWYISACINDRSRRTLYYGILRHPHIRVYYSEELLAEFDGVIERAKFRKSVPLLHAFRLRNLVLRNLKKVTLAAEPLIVRDSCDNYLIGICNACRPHYLVTGDKDLLVLGKYKRTTIVRMHEFLQILGTPLF
ncbi:MAG: putative toxin-antitoxin system toxin component, PIN family [Dyadobacter fermentans]